MERSEEVEGKEILACEAYLDEDLAKKRSFLFQEEWDFLKRRRRVPKGITHRPDQLLRRRTRDRNFFIFLTSFSTRNEETLVGFARLAYDLPYLSFFFFFYYLVRSFSPYLSSIVNLYIGLETNVEICIRTTVEFLLET